MREGRVRLKTAMLTAEAERDASLDATQRLGALLANSKAECRQRESERNEVQFALREVRQQRDALLQEEARVR